MLKIEKLKKIKSNFPVLVGSNVIPRSICKTLIKEISNSKTFDDMIMGGRNHALEKIARGSGSSKRGEHLPVKSSKVIWLCIDIY